FAGQDPHPVGRRQLGTGLIAYGGPKRFRSIQRSGCDGLQFAESRQVDAPFTDSGLCEQARRIFDGFFFRAEALEEAGQLSRQYFQMDSPQNEYSRTGLSRKRRKELLVVETTKTLLIVDDQQGIRLLLKEVFEREGYRTMI